MEKEVGLLLYTISQSGLQLDSRPMCKRKHYTSIEENMRPFLLNKNRQIFLHKTPQNKDTYNIKSKDFCFTKDTINKEER